MELINYFENHRRQLQDWEAVPPRFVGWVVFFAVAFELALSSSLMMGGGLHPSFLQKICFTAILLLIAEYVLIQVAKEVGAIFSKRGNMNTALTFFHLGLLPLLLVLPFSVLIKLSGKFEGFQVILFLILFFRVLKNWREALEVSLELNRWQSSLVLYASSALVGVLIVAGVYFSVIRFLIS